jgi:hypothetical protein
MRSLRNPWYRASVRRAASGERALADHRQPGVTWDDR